MDILMGLVIAMFVITAAYVGFHAADQPEKEAEGHNVTTEPSILNEEFETIQILQKHDFSKLIT